VVSGFRTAVVQMQSRGFTLDYALDRLIGANIRPAR
jgi:hypothetical protein